MIVNSTVNSATERWSPSPENGPAMEPGRRLPPATSGVPRLAALTAMIVAETTMPVRAAAVATARTFGVAGDRARRLRTALSAVAFTDGILPAAGASRDMPGRRSAFVQVGV